MISIGLAPLTSASKELEAREPRHFLFIYLPTSTTHSSSPSNTKQPLMASPGQRIDLASAMLTPFEDNAKARETVTRTDDNGVVQLVPTTILQADCSQLSHIPIDSLLALLLDTCGNAVPPEGTNEDLGLVTALLAANEGGGDASGKDLRKRRAIIGQAFKLLVASTTTSGIPRSGMRRAKIDEATYLLLPSRLQTVQPTDSTQLPSTTPYTTPYTLPPVTTPPPNTSVLGKHGRGSETSSETSDKGEGGGAAYSQAFGLQTDFDVSKQVSVSVCAQQITRLYNPCKQMAEQNRHVQLRPSRTPAALGHLYNSAMRDSTVQTIRCNHTRDCVCLFACNN